MTQPCDLAARSGVPLLVPDDPASQIDAEAPTTSGSPPHRGDFVRRALSHSRPSMEFLTILVAAVLIARAFTAEAYIVPTGSMAPTLLGMHRDYVCPNCSKSFSLGIDDFGREGRPVCPNCGQTDLENALTSESLGDRLLVQKFLYEIRPPRRWEVAVFQNPSDLSQAYVKRVVGLPGESVLLWGGDVYINGQIARKTLAEASAMAIPVYDQTFTPRDLSRYPRWIPRRGDPREPLPSGWSVDGPLLVHSPVADAEKRIDWLDYRHWQPDQGTYGPIRDYAPYNGGDMKGDHRINDLIVSAGLTASVGCEAIIVRLNYGSDRFAVTFPVGDSQPLEVKRNGRLLPVTGLDSGAWLNPSATIPAQVVMAIVDRRLTVTMNGTPVFHPYDFDEQGPGPNWSMSPVGFGFLGNGNGIVSNVKIQRDVYYTEALAQTPRRPHGVEVPFALGEDEFFVLGDNSAVSNDSRFWPGRPVVTRDLFLGKPFLVHLPSQAVPLKVFGRDLYWIPDPREIRYIR